MILRCSECAVSGVCSFHANEVLPIEQWAVRWWWQWAVGSWKLEGILWKLEVRSYTVELGSYERGPETWRTWRVIHVLALDPSLSLGTWQTDKLDIYFCMESSCFWNASRPSACPLVHKMYLCFDWPTIHHSIFVMRHIELINCLRRGGVILILGLGLGVAGSCQNKMILLGGLCIKWSEIWKYLRWVLK